MKSILTISRLIFSGILVISSVCVFGQAPSIQWQKSFGGSDIEYANSVKQTTDNGYIIAGFTKSTNGNITSNNGLFDYWVVKIDGAGNLIWQLSYGGSKNDWANDISQTVDGGYIIVGTTQDSLDGDVGPSNGSYDAWILKINTSGIVQWQKCYGGTQIDRVWAVQQTIDEGYIFVGETNSHDGDVIGNHSFGTADDAWVVKLDSTGSIQWQKCLGGLNSENANSIQQTPDKGYIVAGYAKSTDGDVTVNYGNIDYWVIKLDSIGGIEWQKSLGGGSQEEAQSVAQTADGGYIVAGFSHSNDTNVVGLHGGVLDDYWVVKLNSVGGIQWKKCYGGTSIDQAYSITQTSDLGYVIAGRTLSNDGDVAGNHGSGDYWILKIDSLGTIEWQKCFGGTGNEFGSPGLRFSISQTTDEGYIVSGSSNSTDGDVTGNHGDYDYWIVKLEGATGINERETENTFEMYPNPANSSVFIKAENEMLELIVMDLLGNTMQQLNPFKESQNLNISDFKNGIYFIRIKTQNGISTKKIIVQR